MHEEEVQHGRLGLGRYQPPEPGHLEGEGFREEAGVRPDDLDQERDQLGLVLREPRELPRGGEDVARAGEEVSQSSRL